MAEHQAQGLDAAALDGRQQGREQRLLERMTFTRALQIRRLALELPLDAIVLETDAPDIAPSWIHPGRNSPEELPAIGRMLAELRGIPEDEVRAASHRSALAAIPRLKNLLAP